MNGMMFGNIIKPKFTPSDNQSNGLVEQCSYGVKSYIITKKMDYF